MVSASPLRTSSKFRGGALRQAGYRVLEAGDGGEGVRLAREHNPDLVVTDLGLPFVDGWPATEVLRQDSITAHIPVIAVSSFVHDFYRGRAEAVGCDSLLAKPCPPVCLGTEMMRVLRLHRFFCGPGQQETKGGPLSRLALKLHSAFKLLDGLPDDGKTEPCALRRIRVCPEEPLKDAPLDFGRDAEPVVADWDSKMFDGDHSMWAQSDP